MDVGTSARPVPCPRCGQETRPMTTNTVLWNNEQMYLVEDIPAQYCDNCAEQFYDEFVTDALRHLWEESFPSEDVKRQMTVPVFSLKDRMAKKEAAEAVAAPASNDSHSP